MNSSRLTPDAWMIALSVPLAACDPLESLYVGLDTHGGSSRLGGERVCASATTDSLGDVPAPREAWQARIVSIRRA